jgi:hypothetical protein
MNELFRAIRVVAAGAGVGLLVALIFLASSAHAQLTMPDGKLNTTCAAMGREPPLPVPPPPRFAPGLPKQFKGQCTEALITGNWKGGAVGWWCPKVTPEKAQIAIYAVTWESLTLPMLIDFGMLLMPGVDNAAKMLEMQTKYQSLSILDMCDIWNPIAARLNAIYPAPLPLPPPPGEWKAYGGTIFKHANGKLTGTVSGKTAAKGTPCKGVTVATAGTFVYQELVGGVAGEGTRCIK